MARFTGTGSGKAGPEEQLRDAPGEDTENSQDFPGVLEDVEQPKEGESGTSKSKGKQLGDQPTQAAEGAEAPPEETLPDPIPTDPKPGTSKATTETSTKDPTQATTKNPNEEAPQLSLSMSKCTKQQAKCEAFMGLCNASRGIIPVLLIPGLLH